MPERVDLPPLCIITLLLWRAAFGPWAFEPERARQRISKLFLLMSSEHYIIVKTFNNGSLGSGIDEERSEMR
jgi:hypothetical protein